MTEKRSIDGWAGIVDLGEEPEEPVTSVDALAPHDPVLAAMLELDDEAPKEPESPARQIRALRRPVEERSSAPPAPSPGPREATGGDSSAPAGTTGKSSLRLHAPNHASAPPPSAAPSFSGDQLLAKMAPREAEPARPRWSRWRAYRELIITALVSLVGVVLVLHYGRGEPTPREKQSRISERQRESLRKSAEAGARQRASQASTPSDGGSPAVADTTTAHSQTPPEDAGAEPQRVGSAARIEVPQKTSLRMVSIISSPPGAIVEINGLVHGKTPLVATSPTSSDSIRVKLRLDGYRAWEDTVRADKSGHFIANTTLSKRR